MADEETHKSLSSRDSLSSGDAHTRRPSPGIRIEMPAALDERQRTEVSKLVASAMKMDGISPISEQTEHHLIGADGTDGHDFVAYVGTTIGGYAHLTAANAAELVVHPVLRRQGIGNALADRLESYAGGNLRVWAHGAPPATTEFASKRGYTVKRLLWQLRANLTQELPQKPSSEDVTIRSFVVGQDESQLLKINRRAFASHPEQGTWTLEDLRVRESQPWFDPAGLLVAERKYDHRIMGFHWTKIHTKDDQEPLGEVYVLGVDPDAQGQGLGYALLNEGLVHLRRRGVSTVMLYVDDSNQTALSLYRKLGFTKWHPHLQYGIKDTE